MNEVLLLTDNAFFDLSNLWLLIATALVFIMHLGFATVETGFTQSKNTVNILFKNTMIICIGLLTYFVCGFNLMYPGDFNGFVGFAGFGIDDSAANLTSAYGDYTVYTDFIFQGMFAATCATIVSGAVAGRVKLSSFLIFATIFVALVYPILGSWHWGGGWVSKAGFHDFAGSTLVHAVGGWAALAGIIVIGPRIGKYVDGKTVGIPGHSMPLGAIGVLLLWFGWYGFNGGSVLNADPVGVSLVFVTTSLGAAAGILGSFIMGYITTKKHDVSLVLNGCLAGLVGITAGADVITPAESIIIGLVAGLILPLAVNMFDALKLDDPVGATSVHLVCGIWGTLAAGIFGEGKDVGAQVIGILGYGVAAFSIAFALFFILKVTLGVRVSEEEELEGLDVAEHEVNAYKIYK